MIGLIRKDFCITCARFVYTLIGMGICTATMILSATLPMIPAGSVAILHAIFILLILSEYVAIITQTDLNRLGRYYFMTTPQGIKGVVSSKYYEAAMVYFFGFLYCKICDFFLFLISGKTLDYSLLYLLIIAVLYGIRCVTLPCNIGFGDQGDHIKTILLLTGFCIVLSYGLFGDISFFVSSDTTGGLERLMELLESRTLKVSVNGAGYGGTAKMLLRSLLYLVYVYASFSISSFLFRKGEFTYEA